VGDAQVDGLAFPDVVVRKKGFLGSLSDVRPSLRIDLDDQHPGASFFGVDHLVLNNAAQDPAVVRTCLAYGVLRDAGVPAPRCGFAHVVVNGEDLGAYVHVERPRAAFLRRWFGDDDGALLEGTLSDFAPTWQQTFERERGDERDAARIVEQITAALDVDDDQLLAQLEAVVDLDAFFRFWAAEVVVAHWDGYAGNRNNFLVYAGGDGRARFIASGMDATFEPLPNTPSPAVLAHGRLAGRLYAHPEGRARYRDAIEAEVQRLVANEPGLPLIDRLAAAGVPAGPVNKVSEVFADPFITARNVVHDFVRADGAHIPSVAFPGKLSATPATMRRPPPRVGEDEQSILADWLGG
jgi:hypothetical protein